MKELKAFAKTALLQPDQSETLQLVINAKDLASFSPEDSAWIAETGVYTIEVGNSSIDIKKVKTLNLKSTLTVEKVNNVLNNSADFQDMKR